MFGGFLLGQAMVACQQTVENDRSIHSLHCYFLRPGDTTKNVTFQVTRVRDGRSFSHREAVGIQNEKEVFRIVCSFSVAADTPEYEGKSAPVVPPPEQVDYTYLDFCRDQMPDVDYMGDVRQRPFELLYINPPQSFEPSERIENQLMWMRLTCGVTESPNIHHAGLAYLSDSTLIDHVTIPHGKRWQDSDFDGTSLDHSMWFHKDTRADEWLLFDQKVEWTGDGRGLASGRIYNLDGDLVASCMQEGLMRF